MKVVLMVSRSGANGAQNAGDEIEVSGDEARRMIEAGQAVPARREVREVASKKPRAERTSK